MTTEEGNKLIAEFMGWIYCPTSDNGFVTEHFEKENDWYSIDGLQYNSDWSLLMPVVEKIFKLTEFDSVTEGKYHNRSPYFVQRLQDLSYAVLTIKIERVHEAVTQFIQWYNTQQK